MAKKEVKKEVKNKKNNNSKKDVKVKKSKKKKKQIAKKYLIFIAIIIFILGLSLGVTLGIICHISRFENNKTTNYYNYSLDIITSSECPNDYRLYTTLEDGRNIYTKCIDNIKIRENNKGIKNLDLVLNDDNNIIDKLIENMKLETVYNDGGSELLYTFGSRVYANKEISIINCHHLINNGKYNNDIYIGNDISLQDDVCEVKNTSKILNYQYNCTFTKTYNIVNLLKDYKSEDESYSYIVIDEYQSKYAKTMLIPNSLKNKLKENTYYEVTYHLNGNSKDVLDDIDYINSNIGINNDLVITIDIKKTNKKGVDQINESICKYSKIIEK